jgi:hypothetical protein
MHPGPRRTVPALGFLIAVIALGSAGCSRNTRLGPIRTEREAVAAGGARAARMRIEMAVGELNVSAGADSLLEATFTRNAGLGRPLVTYRIDQDIGRLAVRQPDRNVPLEALLSARGYRNRWDLSLDPGLPLSLDVELGAGALDLKLAGLSLDLLKVNFGAASGRLDLRGDRQRDLEVTIKGGVGSARIILPSRIGVRVEFEGGLGAVDAYGFERNGRVYTNPVYGSTPVLLDIHIEAGIGSVQLETDD